MRSIPRLAFSIVAILFAAPAHPAQGLGGDDTTRVGSPLGDRRAQARGTGNFTVFVDQLREPVGARLGGVVDPRLSPRAMQHYAPFSLPGALMRCEVRMQILAGRGNQAAATVADLHAQGFRVMLTFAGTPAWNSPFPDDKDNFWKYPPVDPGAWADDLVSLLLDIQAASGQWPDYVKIWNEPERDETYLGTRAEFVHFFMIVLARLQTAVDGGELPAGVMRFGGPGMAAWDSPMDGSGPTLYELIDTAGALGLPLDYVCWHEYFRLKPSTSLRYYEPAALLRARGAAAGYPALELIVDEWNIYPSAHLNESALEMDSHRGAATTALFVAEAAHSGLDAIQFFQLQDVDPQEEICDLAGAGNGLMSRRGVKKPSFRILELAAPMWSEERVRVEYPNNEWSAGVIATRLGNRVRVLVAHDPVQSDWVWSQGCRERGGDAGPWWNAYQATLAAGPVNEVTLQQVGGLELWEALSVLQVIYFSREAATLADQPRTMYLSLRGVEPERVALQYPAWLFDDTHNDPADYRSELIPLLNWVEIEARRDAFELSLQVLLNRGYGSSAEFDPELVLTSPEEFASYFGVPQETADEVFPMYLATLEDGRLAQVDLLNAQPATVLREDLPGVVGVRYASGVIEVTLEPAAALVFDFTF